MKAGKLYVLRPTGPKATAVEGPDWKRSRYQPGFLIKRIPGHKIVEDGYGVSYLYVLSWRPDRTKVDKRLYPLSGYYNWKALTASEWLTEESNGRIHASSRNR